MDIFLFIKTFLFNLIVDNEIFHTVYQLDYNIRSFIMQIIIQNLIDNKHMFDYNVHRTYVYFLRYKFKRDLKKEEYKMNNIVKSKKYKKKHKSFMVRWILKHRVICSFGLILLISLAWFQTKAEGKKEVQYQEVVIQTGDTLWKISQKYKSEREDIRDYVALIQQINKVGSIIYPGDILLLPIR